MALRRPTAGVTSRHPLLCPWPETARMRSRRDFTNRLIGAAPIVATRFREMIMKNDSHPTADAQARRADRRRRGRDADDARGRRQHGQPAAADAPVRGERRSRILHGGGQPQGRRARRESDVNLAYANPEADLCSVRGTARTDRDRATIDALWSPVQKVFFPEGKDDPNLVVLRVRVRDAAYWESAGNFIARATRFRERHAEPGSARSRQARDTFQCGLKSRSAMHIFPRARRFAVCRVVRAKWTMLHYAFFASRETRRCILSQRS